MSTIQDADEARRLAVQIVSDIALYNPVKVREGIAKDVLFDVLAGELEEGRVFYENRVSPDLARRTNFFNFAICDILVKPNANIKSKIW
jgi:hypothetical protein